MDDADDTLRAAMSAASAEATARAAKHNVYAMSARDKKYAGLLGKAGISL